MLVNVACQACIEKSKRSRIIGDIVSHIQVFRVELFVLISDIQFSIILIFSHTSFCRAGVFAWCLCLGVSADFCGFLHARDFLTLSQCQGLLKSTIFVSRPLQRILMSSKTSVTDNWKLNTENHSQEKMVDIIFVFVYN